MSEIAREAEVCDHCGTDERTLGQLTRRAEAAERERDLATGQILMVGSEIGGDPKLDPMDYRDPRWTPTLEEAAKLRAEAERLRGALERAERALQGIATAQRFDRDVFSDDSAYVDWARSLSLHVAEIARAALAGEGKAKRCAWTYDKTHFAWDSSCGEKWILMDGGPSENEIRFCHGCGKPVEVACEATPEKARQEEGQ